MAAITTGSNVSGPVRRVGETSVTVGMHTRKRAETSNYPTAIDFDLDSFKVRANQPPPPQRRTASESSGMFLQ